MKKLTTLSTLLGLALLAKTTLATVPTKPPTGDDELDDLEVQRFRKNRKRTKKAVGKRSGKVQVVAYTNEDAPKYSKEDWVKGQLLGVLEVDDPEKETDLGTGVFLLAMWMEKDEAIVLFVNEKTGKIITKSQGMIHKEKLPAKDLVKLDISEEASDKNQCGRCAKPYAKRVIKTCWKILGIEVFCVERTEKVSSLAVSVTRRYDAT
jgi:hypothetical protein